MLGNIKEMINKQKAYLEEAAIIYEDGVGNLDDLIVLGEEGENEEGENENIQDNPNENEESSENLNHDNIEGNNDDDDQDDNHDDHDEIPDQNTNLLDEPIDNEIGSDNNEDDILNNDADDLPTPVGLQTGEPIEGNIDNLLSMDIDLKSNTPKDILPIPPAGAGDVVNSDSNDLLNQKIDSGFSNENEQDNVDISQNLESDILNSDIDLPLEDTNPVTEAITIGDESDNNEGGESNNKSETPPDASEENDVTSAVKDKVAEADTPEENIEIGDNDVSSNSKEDIMKKLSSITKSLEDAKNAIMKSI